MGATTGIKWTDSTYNSWWGCTKVGPACDHCYAEAVDRRTGENHWGHGAPRRLLSEHARNEPYRWQRQAAAFEAKNGRRRRAFTLSMGDLFDKEVPEDWRWNHFRTLEDCDAIDWQICTKRIGLVDTMVPEHWRGDWPRHVGLMITAINQREADRDLAKLLWAKSEHGIPWIGVSYEPAQGEIDFTNLCNGHYFYNALTGHRWHDAPEPFIGASERFSTGLDWIIFGGESGAGWRACDLNWARKTRDDCAHTGTAFFMKQVAAFRPTDAMIPADLMVRQFPQADAA